jgi:hypothetical protein
MHSHGQDGRLRAFGIGTGVWNHGGVGGPALPAVYTRIFPRPAVAVAVAVATVAVVVVAVAVAPRYRVQTLCPRCSKWRVERGPC